MPKGNNTAIIHTRKRNVLTHADQIRNRIEDVCMEEPDVDDSLNLSEGDRLEEHMEEDVAETNTQYDDSSEDKIRPRYPLHRTSPLIFRTSDRKTMGIRPVRYREIL